MKYNFKLDLIRRDRKKRMNYFQKRLNKICLHCKEKATNGVYCYKHKKKVVARIKKMIDEYNFKHSKKRCGFCKEIIGYPTKRRISKYGGVAYHKRCKTKVLKILKKWKPPKRIK